jgi:hypothetical protein
LSSHREAVGARRSGGICFAFAFAFDFGFAFSLAFAFI